MLPEVLIARERLLATAKGGPPGPIPFLPLLPPKPSAKNSYKPLYVRARQRYFEELAAIWSEVGGEESEDDNYPEGPSESTFKKRKTMQSSQVYCKQFNLSLKSYFLKLIHIVTWICYFYFLTQE